MLEKARNVRRASIRIIREHTDKELRELNEEFLSNPKNAAICFALAEKYYSEDEYDKRDRYKAEYFLKKALELDLSAQSRFEIIHQRIHDGRFVTILNPKEQSPEKEIWLNGWSFYSFLLQHLGEFLISNQRPNIIINMQDIECLSDLGDPLLLYLQREAQERGGDVKCFHVRDEVKALGALMEWWPDKFGFYDTQNEAIKYFEQSQSSIRNSQK